MKKTITETFNVTPNELRLVDIEMGRFTKKIMWKQLGLRKYIQTMRTKKQYEDMPTFYMENTFFIILRLVLNRLNEKKCIGWFNIVLEKSNDITTCGDMLDFVDYLISLNEKRLDVDKDLFDDVTSVFKYWFVRASELYN